MKSVKEDIHFWFRDELVLRTPALPFIENLSKEKIDALLQDNNFIEAIFLASPALYNECMRLKNDLTIDTKKIKKIRVPLIKYYQRMYSRCTPFGLFAGCSFTQWQSKKNGIILPTPNFYRKTRLDMNYLCALMHQLVSITVIRYRLLYFPNNSAYRIGNELRYIEYKYSDGKRLHQVSAVVYSEYLNAVMQKASLGATIGQLIDLLVLQAEVTITDAQDFIEEMIKSQVLISELDPAITGSEFIYQILDCLKRINLPLCQDITKIIEQLEEVVNTLKQVDSVFGNSPEIYISLSEKLKKLNVPFEMNKLFQTDMYCKNGQGGINENIKTELLGAVKVLAKLCGHQENQTLKAFAERFRKRYEDRMMPLLQVLDVETGIGYKHGIGKNLSPLLADIILPPQKKGEDYNIKWNKREEWLFDLLLQHKNASEVVITEADLIEFSDSLPKIPPSMAVMFRLTEDNKIILENCGGSSAANILGRFAHGNKPINNLVRKITSEEQEINKDIVFAEIVHLPEDRIGNILLHPAFHNYEIPFLARSSLPLENQVLLQDILISVQRDNRIRLYSKKLNKEIIPRLTNAHNYSMQSLPVYHFLADVQTQGFSGGWTFKWSGMARYFKYLPRVKYNNVVLFEAEWLFRAADIQKLLASGKHIEAYIEFIKKEWKIPRYSVLVDRDNELLIDLESKESVNAFITTIKERKLITLKEFLWPQKDAVANEHNGIYNNQFIAILMNKQAVYNVAGRISGADKTTHDLIKRKFLPGSEWLYYKVFCGTNTADDILVNCIIPLTEQLLKLNIITKWFFIRYNEDGFHIRLRFQLKNKVYTGKVMQLVMQYMEESEKNEQIWKIQLDTYERELERYKGSITVFAEDIFFYDSKMKLQFLLHTEGDEREKYRWVWGLRGVDQLLNAFKYSLEEKYKLIQHLSAVFTKEFNADKLLFQQLNRKSRDCKSLIQLAMEYPVSETNEMKPIIDIYEVNQAELIKTAGQILNTEPIAGNQMQLNNFIESCIHMNLNRLFLSEPRFNEMIIYYFLSAYYLSSIKKQEKINPNKPASGGQTLW